MSDVSARIIDARKRLASTAFDPTLRQLQAELFMKERAAVAADQALEAALARIAELEQDVAAARARVDVLSGRLDDALGPRVVDIVAGAP